MKYSEFIDILDHYGYVIEDETYDLYVNTIKGVRLMCIDKEDNHAICTDYVEFLKMPNDEKDFLLGIGIDLAKTPLAEREEEKRYYLQFIHPNILGEREPFYLHLHHSESAKDYYEIGTVKAPFGNKLQTIFTESEIAEMDITGFQKVEVVG